MQCSHCSPITAACIKHRLFIFAWTFLPYTISRKESKLTKKLWFQCSTSGIHSHIYIDYSLLYSLLKAQFSNLLLSISQQTFQQRQKVRVFSPLPHIWDNSTEDWKWLKSGYSTVRMGPWLVLAVTLPTWTFQLRVIVEFKNPVFHWQCISLYTLQWKLTVLSLWQPLPLPFLGLFLSLYFSN